MSEPEQSPGRLVLLRHGQGSLGTDDYDRLSDIGWMQSQQLGKRLRADYGVFETIWLGSLKRHHQTVEGLKTQVRREVLPDLNEYTVDQLIGSALAQANELGLRVPDDSAFDNPKDYLETFRIWFPEVLAHWQSGGLACEHNGQWDAFFERVTRPLSDWQDRVSSGETVVAVTSAGVISTMASHALNQSLAWQRNCNISLYNASVTELSLQDGQWQLHKLNCISHLEHPAHQTFA